MMKDSIKSIIKSIGVNVPDDLIRGKKYIVTFARKENCVGASLLTYRRKYAGKLLFFFCKMPIEIDPKTILCLEIKEFKKEKKQ